MSLTFKLLSLAIRTAAKPIGNYIKRQAKDHDGFRRFAVAQAQRVHRIDMRMRLGILHDPEAQQRMHEREQKAAEERKRRDSAPTVRTEEEQKKHDELKATQAQEQVGSGMVEAKPHKIKIRPLSEVRAIELGANFFSEAFIFAVAAGLLIWDSWRSRKKESQRRDEVAERLEQLESEVESLRAKLDPDLESLHELDERIKEAKKARQKSWWNPWSWGRSVGDDAAVEESSGVGIVDAQKDEEEERHIVPIRKANMVTARIVGVKEAVAQEASKQAYGEAERKDGSREEKKANGSREEKKANERMLLRVDSVDGESHSR